VQRQEARSAQDPAERLVEEVEGEAPADVADHDPVGRALGLLDPGEVRARILGDEEPRAAPARVEDQPAGEHGRLQHDLVRHVEAGRPEHGRRRGARTARGVRDDAERHAAARAEGEQLGRARDGPVVHEERAVDVEDETVNARGDRRDLPGAGTVGRTVHPPGLVRRAGRS